MEARIQRDYVTPGHPTAFAAPATVAKYYGIRPAKAREILEHVNAYLMHREFKKPHQYNPYFIYRKRDLIQADLIEIRELADENNGVNYLLLLIDCFTRKIWVYPIANKSAITMTGALSLWLNELGPRGKPKRIGTDKGNEFFNREVRKLFRDHGIVHDLQHGTSKAAYAERANKTLQILIYKYLTHVDTYRYIDHLDELVNTYNSRPSRPLEGLSPNEAEAPRNQRHVRAAAIRRWSKIKRKSPKFAVGDRVRVKIDAHALHPERRAYAQQFKGEYFIIVDINERLPVPLYYIKSEDTEERIKEGFYAEELQRVRGDIFLIEDEIAHRRRRGVDETLVKWKYFGPRWNQWIPTAQVQQLGPGIAPAAIRINGARRNRPARQR